MRRCSAPQAVMYMPVGASSTHPGLLTAEVTAAWPCIRAAAAMLGQAVQSVGCSRGLRSAAVGDRGLNAVGIEGLRVACGEHVLCWEQSLRGLDQP